jgi:hypothetical protein
MKQVKNNANNSGFSKAVNRLSKITIAFILLVITAVAIACYKYPILFKLIYGEAQIMGKPIQATVYTDGHLNTDINVYRDKKFNRYLLRLKEYDQYGMLQYIIIDPIDTLIGRPVSSNEADYTIINGILFRSEVGAQVVDFRNDMKGFGFNLQMEFNSKQIKFNVPPKQLKFDSVRILLNSR